MYMQTYILKITYIVLSTYIKILQEDSMILVNYRYFSKWK